MRRWHGPNTISGTPIGLDRFLFVELVPYRWRRLHHWYAACGGYFWLPCPVCGREFGGHEARAVAGKPYEVPDPRRGPMSGRLICPECTAAGRGEVAGG
ncbi:MAG TPA: hypothetical protein VIV12_22420 [Streptosporangiaceae bacterium]